ncbi:MAG: Asp23/Gls24 family envelope stress response protein [Coriobacteriales bacterium]|nr:Asp23/Gls24 family envelope stress response protein [Coriobacteriales bacterium]
MSDDKTSVNGTLTISNSAIIDMIGYAALESYGVVGMVAASLPAGIAHVLPARAIKRGIHITREKTLVPGASELISEVEYVNVDLYIIVEQGVNLAVVSKNLADAVRYVLNEYAGVNAGNIEVHVQGIHASERTGDAGARAVGSTRAESLNGIRNAGFPREA